MSAPIGNTCPDIDKVIKRLEPLIKQISRLKSYDYEDAKLTESILDECRYEMDNAIDIFEDLRSGNDKLRSWGQSMEEEAEGLSVELRELQDRYDELEEQLKATNVATV